MWREGGIAGGADETRAPPDIEIHAREIIEMRTRLDQILADDTGQPLQDVARDTERDYFMSADEAKQYGIIDRVIVRH